MNKSKKRLLIIGAGPSGLSLLRAFQSELHNLENFPQIICCQKQPEWGGQWNYVTKSKFDKNGILIPSTNQYLWTNAPKQCFQYPDYSFDDHFNGLPMPSYLPRSCLRDYFIKRFQQSNIKRFIKFETMVRNIKFLEDLRKFSVQIHHLNSKTHEIQYFDYVIVASGHYSAPNMPKFQGMDSFSGKLLHSVQIKDYEDFKDEKLLIVGTGLSAEDAVLQSYKYGAKSIKISYRTKPMSQKFPKEIEQFPQILRIQGKSVTFLNGHKEIFDTIIMCTGYIHNFSFLDKQLRLQTTNKLWSEKLYMGIVWQNNPQLMYLGMQAQLFSFLMFDIQSSLARDFVLGKKQIPLVEEMKLDTQRRIQKEKAVKSFYDIIYFIGGYLKDMIRMCNYTGYKLDKVIELYIQLQKHKQTDIITFRDNIYQSTVTGKWSIKKLQTWLESGHKFEMGQETLEKITA